MHGRGADELDLLALVDELDPERRLVGLAPRGPLALPPGGHHWYAVRRVGFPDPDTFHPTFELVAQWLDAALAEHGVELSRTVIGGFSQGAVMSYALGLGRGRPAPAGILALSGFIPRVERFELDLGGRAGLPVAIGHGTLDPIIGVEWGRQARELLEDAGASVMYREARIGHSVEPAYLPDLAAWLRRTLDGEGHSAMEEPQE